MSEIDDVNWNIKNDESGDNVAMLAVRENMLESLKILSQIQGIDWNIRDDFGDTVAMIAPHHIECLKILVQVQNIDWNIINKGRTPAFIAMEQGRKCIQIISEMENINWNIQCQSKVGFMTPLIFGVDRGYSQCLKILRQMKNIDWNQKNSFGQTLPMIARYHLVNIARLLQFFQCGPLQLKSEGCWHQFGVCKGCTLMDY